MLSGNPFSRTDLRERVDDAELVALAGVRQGVKNLLLVHTLRDGADFEEAWYVKAVHREIESIATQSEADSARILRELARARKRRWRVAVTAIDYVSKDVPSLRLRAQVCEALAKRLREFARNREEVQKLMNQAREQALDEIASAAASVGQGVPVLHGSLRRIALQDLQSEIEEMFGQSNNTR